MPKVRALTEAERRRQADKARDDALMSLITEERARKQITLTEIAAKLGMSRVCLNSRFKSPSSLTLKEYRDICAMLGMEVRV